MEKERIIEITSLEQPGVELFGALTEAQLRNRLEPEKGVFIAESPKVIRVALDAGYEPLALLCERKHLAGDAADILARCPDIPVYTGGRELLARLTGYTLTRGVLCAMRRASARHHRRSRLHGAHPDGARGGLAQRGGSIRRSVLGAADDLNLRFGDLQFTIYNIRFCDFETQIFAAHTLNDLEAVLNERAVRDIKKEVLFTLQYRQIFVPLHRKQTNA